MIPASSPSGGSLDAGAGLRALQAVLDRMDPDVEEGRLLGDALEALVSTLDLGGAAVFRAMEEAGAATPLEAVAAAGARGEGSHELVGAALAGRAATRKPTSTGWTAAVPMAGRQALVGALFLHGKAKAPDDALLDALGRALGAAVESSRRCAQLRAASREAQVLHRIASALASGTEVASVLPAFAEELAQVQRFDRLACGFVNESGDYLEVATHPAGAAWGFGGVLPLVGSGLGSALLNGAPVLQADLVHSHRFIEDMRLLEDGMRSYVALPLVTRGQAIGVLALARREQGAFSNETAQHLEPIISAAALALENVRLLQKTRELSITDEVTPLFNFRFFHQILDRELKLVDRYRSVLSLLFMDLDRFKPINDKWGHLRGSRVLREVGFLLRAAVRETDYPARYGGDEFVVILPQTDGAAARTLADKLRRLIEGHSFLQEEGINARIGVSVGVASYPVEAASKEALVRLADERMYGDKGERKRPDE